MAAIKIRAGDPALGIRVSQEMLDALKAATLERRRRTGEYLSVSALAREFIAEGLQLTQQTKSRRIA